MALPWKTIKQRAITFYTDIVSKMDGREKANAQRFIQHFLNIFDVNIDIIIADNKAAFEYKVPQPEGHKGYIDFLWKGKILVEMKSKDKSLDDALKQAYSYTLALSENDIVPLIMVSDFENIWITDRITQITHKFETKNLYKKVEYFKLIAGFEATKRETTEDIIAINAKAALKLSKLHNICANYGYDSYSLEIYLVRILFCLFADNTGIFEKFTFRDYIETSCENGEDLPPKIQKIFEVLNISDEERKRKTYLTPDLLQFQYVNGGLFKERLEMPPFDTEMRKILIECASFDWSRISPAIFGAMFQGVMNDELRRQMGAHYTSEENILKVIKPLFLDDLWSEFEKIKLSKIKLKQFHDKIASLKFLDPACGCGNFLIIAYRELRKLEYEVINMLRKDTQQVLDLSTLLKVNINQFYGIEIEDFPHRIAQVGMWLMEHQMNLLAADKLGKYYIDLPLKSSATIVCANALTMGWNNVVPKDELSYIMGNPPFNGARTMTDEQKDDMEFVFGESYHGLGNLDYVCAWYKKAADMMKENHNIRTAFVSTNSISQGQQPPILWKNLIEKENFKIDFAYRTFKWTNEAPGMAAVHCVIIGFSHQDIKTSKSLVNEDEKAQNVLNINAYLIDAPSVFFTSRRNPICNVPKLVFGSMPNDNKGLLSDLPDDFVQNIKEKYPFTQTWFRQFIGADEFINGIHRWCLWLKGIDPDKIKKCTEIMKIIEKVRQVREQSRRQATRNLADTSYLFGEIRQPESQYVYIPCHSSEKRKYIPMGFMSPNVIAGNADLFLTNATPYEFGVLQSKVHMAWVKAICGRIKSDFRYSADIVYNNFPWPTPTNEQKLAIEKAAQTVLDVRDNYKESSLAVLYNPLIMQKDLLNAHKKLDKAVIKAYNKNWVTENEIVTDLMKMYQSLVDKEAKELAEKVRIKGKRGRKRKSDA